MMEPILVVGHQPARAAAVAEVLVRGGFEVWTLLPTTLTEVLRRSNPLGVVVLIADLSLEQGRELVQELRGVPMLWLGSAQELERTQAYGAVGIRVVLEPCPADPLVEQVAHCLQQVRETRHHQDQLAALQERLRSIEADTWLSDYLHKRAVVDIFNQLRDEISAHIQHHLHLFFSKPHLINRLNRDLIDEGVLDPQQVPLLKRHFWRQLQAFPELGTILYASCEGIYVGLMRMRDGSFTAGLKLNQKEPHKRSFRVDDRGMCTPQQVGISRDYDPRSRPWYQAALAGGQPTWSPLYQFTTSAEVQLGIMAVQPLLNDQGELLGVVGADVIPWQLSGFLQQIWGERAGATFIVDRSGWMVANSAAEPSFQIDHQTAIQHQAGESDNPWICKTVRHLIERFGSLATIDQEQRCEFVYEGEPQYVQIQPFQDGLGLDWLVILVVPESDILKHSHVDTWSQIHEAFTSLEETNRSLEQQIAQRTAQLREQERLNQLQEDFFSIFSHELRTPLANLRMALHMTRWASTEEARQKYFEVALLECETEIELITDLVNLRKLESDTYELAIAPLNLRLWLPSLVDLFQVQAESHQQELIFDHSDPELAQLGTIYSDRFCLERILRELLTNAIKYTSPGGQIQVEVSSELERVQIRVGNSAEIPVEELPRLFDKFYRVPDGDRWNRGGTGLGLALVKRMVLRLRGQIWVRSEEGWTWFVLGLPVRQSEDPLDRDQGLEVI